MDFSTEYWASHRTGRRTRERILAELERNPNLTVAELSELCGRCERQIRRQLAQIRLDKQVLNSEPKLTYMGSDLKKICEE